MPSPLRRPLASCSPPPAKRHKSDRSSQSSDRDIAPDLEIVSSRPAPPSTPAMGEPTAPAHTRSQGPPPSYSESGHASCPPHQDLGNVGRLAAKWVTDLVDGDLGPGTLLCTRPGTSHDLLTITNQSVLTDDFVVCICSKCKKTLTIRFTSLAGHSCSQLNRPHHLVSVDESYIPHEARTKYYPMLSAFTFKCSSMKCSMEVTLDVCAPRLDPQREPDLVDREAPRRRLEGLQASDGNPNRYQELVKPDKAPKLFPAFYMLQYLNDVINPGARTPPLRVSRRNKFFEVCFGDRFRDLFDDMEFEVITVGEEEFVQLPTLDGGQDVDHTLVSTRRAWFEILRIHFHFLQEGLPDRLKQPIDLHIQPGTKDVITRILDAQYARTRFTSVDDYNPADFTLLGVNRDAHESLLWYACHCQGQTNPAIRRTAYEALSRVSRGRESQNTELRQYLEDEAIALTTIMSMNDARPSPLSRAYQSLQVPETTNDMGIVRAFHDRLHKAKSPQAMKSERLTLSVIGKARKSSVVMNAACAFDNPEEAALFLDVTTATEPDFIISQLVVEADEGRLDKILGAAALRALANIHEADARMRLIQYAFQLEGMEGEPWLQAGESITVVPGAAADKMSSSQVGDPSLPVGLVNIRNTCYLNSILQYFNTVVPVREVVLNWEEYKLEPTEENIKSRRLGGSGSALDKAEAFLAAKFVEEMRSLYLELRTATQVAIRPQQRLALAALKTADQIMKGAPKETTAAVFGPQPNPHANTDLPPPPPLPARPSPKPPTQSRRPSSEPTVTVNQVLDNGDAGSTVSSATLVDQKDEEQDQTYVTVAAPEEDKFIPQVVPAKARSALDDDDLKQEQTTEADDIIRGRSITREQDRRQGDDVEMSGTGDVAGAPAAGANLEDSLSVEDKITEALNDTSATGTDQQDVEEVMGNILEHLHAAIKPTGVDEKTGRQTDIITETFYWSSVNQIRTIDMKTGKPQSPYRAVPDLSRWMTAFPDEEGGIDLYAALDKTFDQEFQEDGSETFTSITKTPPILHVYIQRSQNVAGRLTRNGNVVEIPETLYLDRYMDRPTDSDVFEKRQKSWNLKRRLKALESRARTEVGPPKSDKGKQKEEIKEAGYEVLETIEEYESEPMSVDHTGEGEGEEEYVSILDSETQAMLAEHGLMPQTKAEREDTAMTEASHEQLLANLDHDAARRVQGKAVDDRAKTAQELAEIFTDMHDIAYRLHAVICHGGGYGSGHYWVWIFDFEESLWRKYNDETIEVHTDNRKVLTDLNASGNPYYVAYVRADDVGRLVTVPPRLSCEASAAGQPSADDAAVIDPSKLESPGAADEVINGIDVDMDDARLMHVENRDE